MRLLVLTISFVYLSFSSGITVSSHYCLGLLKNVEFGSHHFKCCCAELMAMMDDDCCDDEEKTYKVSDDQTLSESPEIAEFDLEINLHQNSNFPVPLLGERLICKDIRPPPDISPDRLEMCSLILYA